MTTYASIVGKLIPSADPQWWTKVIGAVKGPFGLITLVVLVVLVIVVGAIFGPSLSPGSEMILVGGTLCLLFAVVCIAGTIAVRQFSIGARRRSVQSIAEEEMTPRTETDADIAPIVKEHGAEVLFSGNEKRPTLGCWYRELRPFLHQAEHYSVPTYYLDTNLNVIDWNIAFEVVFEDLVGRICGKHVNWFIARLSNYDEVFDHAREFTKSVIEEGTFPYVDMEPIVYESPEFGIVETMKVATQLTDESGAGRGWAVALFPKQINWTLFQEKLFARIYSDKQWSVYSASYDRVLLQFPPYKQLIDDVVSVVPDGNLAVADLGCGTGNATQALVKRGHRVTAIEGNLGMLDGFAAKRFDPEVTRVVKASLDHIDFVPSGSFDAVIMVNVLYALEHPLECLRSVHRILRPNGVVGLSTTHRDTNLDPLLDSIKARLEENGQAGQLASDWETVYKVNKGLESSVARRHTRGEIIEMVGLAGFDIIKDVPSTYEGAVTVLHLRKRADEVSATVN